jgi:hypothetical protein
MKASGGAVWAEVSDGSLEAAVATLNASSTVDLTARGAEWRREGWTG